MRFDITTHAIERYIERFDRTISFMQARDRLRDAVKRAKPLRKKTLEGQERWWLEELSCVAIVKVDRAIRMRVVVTIEPSIPDRDRGLPEAAVEYLERKTAERNTKEMVRAMWPVRLAPISVPKAKTEPKPKPPAPTPSVTPIKNRKERDREVSAMKNQIARAAADQARAAAMAFEIEKMRHAQARDREKTLRHEINENTAGLRRALRAAIWGLLAYGDTVTLDEIEQHLPGIIKPDFLFKESK